jgi:outer membrane protein assembly factor BamD (BamD/ComL family)
VSRNRKSPIQRHRALHASAAALVTLALAPGCWHKSVLRDPKVLEQAATATEREALVLRAGNWEKQQAPEPGTAQGDLHVAQALFRAEDYPKAAKAFEEVAENHKGNAEVHEQALYMKAEANFQQGKYVDARDGYEELLKTYPGSRHRGDAARRMFQIADIWLEEAREDMRRGSRSSLGRFVHFEPDRKPLFDQDGHAIKNLENVRQHDPNGPLADDSLMVAAGYHFSMGDYQEAALLSDQLIHNYPRSEHQAQAHLLNAQSKLHAYKGAAYDPRSLEEARRTLRSALNLFPNELESERQRIYRELDEIRNSQAKTQFEIAEWYRTHGHPKSARLYYRWILQQKDFAGTKWAERAQQRLAELDQTPATTDAAHEPAAETPKRPSLFRFLSRGDASAEGNEP